MVKKKTTTERKGTAKMYRLTDESLTHLETCREYAGALLGGQVTETAALAWALREAAKTAEKNLKNNAEKY